jgi:hypothetical protein
MTLINIRIGYSHTKLYTIELHSSEAMPIVKRVSEALMQTFTGTSDTPTAHTHHISFP